MTAIPGGAGYCPRHTVCPIGCPHQRVQVPATVAPADDLMALADAVGVTVPVGSFEASIALLLTDDRLDAVLSKWSRDSAEGVHAALCPMCGDTGLIDAKSWWGGNDVTVTCPACNGDGGDLR